MVLLFNYLDQIIHYNLYLCSHLQDTIDEEAPVSSAAPLPGTREYFAHDLHRLATLNDKPDIEEDEDDLAPLLQVRPLPAPLYTGDLQRLV